jgi:hypothetical protein
VKAAGKKHPHMVIPWLLMASWLYYIRYDHSPILSDAVYDRSCKWLMNNFDKVEHPHYKKLITEEALEAGSLFKLTPKDYPSYLIWLAEILSEAEELPEWISIE